MQMRALTNDGVSMQYMINFNLHSKMIKTTVYVATIKNVMARSDIMHIEIIAFNNLLCCF